MKLDVTVVCPFYNEEVILEKALQRMLTNLESLDRNWELVVVDDGSTDGSLAIAREVARDEERLRVIHYDVNRGRGYALRTGVREARGDIVVTTEVDGSWGDEVVQRILEKFGEQPAADVVIASPHLPGGGYRNVPFHRVLLSTLGNYVIRAGLTYEVTMNTGMTRGYRRKQFLALPLDEDGKEMHLEVINKALAFGYRIYEVPAVLEWKDHKLTSRPDRKRTSSSKIRQLIQTHVLFSVLAAPFRYFYLAAALLSMLSAGFLVWAVMNLFRPAPSIFLFLGSLMLAVFALMLFGISVLAQQGRAVQRELWRLRSGERRDEPGT